MIDFFGISIIVGILLYTYETLIERTFIERWHG